MSGNSLPGALIEAEQLVKLSGRQELAWAFSAPINAPR